MARRQVAVDDALVWIADDERPLPELGWWAVLRTRVVDEITEAPPNVPLRVASDTAACRPRMAPGGMCGLVARPRDASTALTVHGALRATVHADGYLPQVLDRAIDAARRQLPAGAAAGATSLVVAPADTAARPQFRPGRGVMLQRPLPTSPEQFTLQADPGVAVPLNQVPLADAVEPARGVNARVAGVPIVLADQRLHRAEPARIRGRALRQLAPGSAPIPAPAARIGIRGVWWTQREVAANSMPPHPTRLVSFAAPLAFEHVAGTTLERAALTGDGIARRCKSRASVRAPLIEIHPWNGLNPAGGDVLRLEGPNHLERELVVTAGFDASVDPAAPARVGLRTPLAFDHAADAPVERTTVVATVLGTLEREAVAGDRVLFADTLAGVPTNDVLRLAGTAADAELRFVRCLPTHDGGVFSHLVALAADGTFELPPIARVAQVQFFVEHAGSPVQLPIDFHPEPGAANALQVLFTP
jgi:hypothetical protein